jgi:hypothetical protein
MLVKVYKVSCRALLLATAFGLYAASPAMSQNPPPAVIAPAPEQGADVPEYPQAVPVDSKVQPLIPTPPAVEPVAAGEQILYRKRVNWLRLMPCLRAHHPSRV